SAKVIRDVSRIPPGEGIFGYGVDTGVSYVAARSHMYDGYAVERRLEYHKPFRMVVRDTVRSENLEAFSFATLFHFPTDKQITITDSNSLAIASRGGSKMQITVAPVPLRFTVQCGDTNKAIAPSWFSERVTKLTASQCVSAEFQGVTNTTWTITLVPRNR